MMDDKEKVHGAFDEAAEKAKWQRKERESRKANGAAGNAARFKLTRFRDIKLETENNYLIKGLIPREGLVVIWGPAKCGKTFLVYDMGMHIARGWAYRGRRVTQGPFVYVACEGERGLAARTEAYRQKYFKTQAADLVGKPTEEPVDIPFYLVTSRLDLVGEHKLLITDIRAQIGVVQPVAIVIDTLNRSIRGSESPFRKS
jgi:RecA-family ATPase